MASNHPADDDIEMRDVQDGRDTGQMHGMATQSIRDGGQSFTSSTGDTWTPPDESQSISTTTKIEDSGARPKETLGGIEKPWDELYVTILTIGSDGNPLVLSKRNSDKRKLRPVVMQFLLQCCFDKVVKKLQDNVDVLKNKVKEIRPGLKSLNFIYHRYGNASDVQNTEDDMDEIIFCLQDLAKEVNFEMDDEETSVNDPTLILKEDIEQRKAAVYKNGTVYTIVGIIKHRKRVLDALRKKSAIEKTVKFDNHMRLQLIDVFDFQTHAQGSQCNISVTIDYKNCTVSFQGQTERDILLADSLLQEYWKFFKEVDFPTESRLHGKLLVLPDVQYTLNEMCMKKKLKIVWSIAESLDKVTCVFDTSEGDAPLRLKDEIVQNLVRKTYPLKQVGNEVVISQTQAFIDFVNKNNDTKLVYDDTDGRNLHLVMLKNLEFELMSLEMEFNKSQQQQQKDVPSILMTKQAAVGSAEIHTHDKNAEFRIRFNSPKDVQTFTLLNTFGFEKEMRSKGIQMEISVETSEIAFVGISNDDMQEAIHCFLFSLCRTQFTNDKFPMVVLKFIKEPHITQKVNSELQRKNVICQWFVSEDCDQLQLYAKDGDCLKAAEEIIRKTVKWQEFGNTPDFQRFMLQPHVKTFFDRYASTLKEEDRDKEEVVVVGLEEPFGEFSHQFDKFCQNSKPSSPEKQATLRGTYKKQLGISSLVLTYLEKHKQQEWREYLRNVKVEPETDDDQNVVLVGPTEQSVKDAVSGFWRKCRFSVNKWSCEVPYPKTVLQKNPPKTKQALEQDNQCLIEMEEDTKFVQQQQFAHFVDWFTKTQLILIDAKAYEVAADVVVLPTNEAYSPSSLGTTILEKGGNTTKADFSQKRIAVKDSIYISTQSGNLPCQMIAYVAIPEYKHGTSMQFSVVKCLMDLFRQVDKTLAQSLVIPVKILDHIPETTFLHWFCEAFLREYKSLENLKQIYLCAEYSKITEQIVDVLKTALVELHKYSFLHMFERPNLGKVPENPANITISLVQGKLVDKQVDVIVNSSNYKLELEKGAVSASILQKAGKEIQDECKERFPGGIDYGQVVATLGGRTNFAFILHGALPHWTPGAKLSSQLLQKLVFDCLVMTGKEGQKSIAFPVFGTGNLLYPWDEVAKVMIETVKKYGRMEGRKTSIKEVVIVLYEKDFKSIEAFEKKKTESEEICLRPEDPGIPPQLILESRCDNVRVQVVPLKDVDCHNCKAVVKFKTYAEIMTLRNEDMKKALKTETFFIDDSTDPPTFTFLLFEMEKDLKKAISNSINFIKDRRLASLAVCLIESSEKGFNYKTQAACVKEVFVCRNKKKTEYLQLVKVIVPNREQFDLMVSATVTKQEEESKQWLLTKKWGELINGNKNQWKCVSNICHIESPRIIINTVSENNQCLPKLKEKLERAIEEAAKQNADFKAFTIRQDSREGQVMWIRFEKGNFEKKLPLDVCKQINEAMELKNPNVEINEDGDVYVYDFESMAYKIIGKDDIQGKFYPAETASLHQSGKTASNNNQNLQNDKVFDGVIGEIKPASIGKSGTDLIQSLKKKFPNVKSKKAAISGIIELEFPSIVVLDNANEYLKKEFKTSKECITKSKNQPSDAPQRPERKKKKSSTSDDFDIISVDVKIEMDKDMFQKVIFFSTDEKDNKIRNALYKDGHLFIKLNSEEETKQYEKRVKDTMGSISQLSSVDIQFENTAKRNEIEKLLETDYSTIYCKFSGNIVSLFGSNYEELQKVKHRVELATGIIKQEVVGRRNRRFADPTSDYARSKDDSNTNQRPQNQSSQSLSRTVGGTKPSMEQVYTTPDGLVVKVYVGNILSLDVDCIVNAANENLQHGGGVAAVISQAAGYSFDQESSDYIARNGPLPVGTCCSTSAGNLKYNYVIHTVGPRWGDYKFDEKKACAADLKASLVCCFVEADKLQQKSIALPSISAGIFGVPKEVCVTEYRNAVMEYSRNYSQTKTSLKEIHFIDKDYGLISLIQNEFGGSFNLSTQQSSASGGSNTPPSGKKPDFSRSMSSSSSSSNRSSSSPNKSFKSGQSLGGGSKNFNQTQKFETAVFILQQKMRIEVKVEDITEMKLDAIVCPQDDLMTNRGAIARKIADIAGHDYQMEVARIYDVKKTGAKRMNAPKKCPWKYVIQTKPPRWNLDAQKHNQQFEKELKETVINILNASKFSTIKTLAMPLMGIAEKGDTPVITFADQFAKAILKQIHDKDFTVGEIHIVVHDIGTASSIIDVLDALDDKGFKRVGKSTHRKLRSDKEKSFAASVGGTEKLDGQCCICIDVLQNPKKLPCGHVFCTKCIDQQFEYKPSCPQCGATHGVIIGTQPKGRMDISSRKTSLAGYEGHDTIIIYYDIYPGTQGEEHPTPGRYFEGIKRSAYLPATKKGKMISKLLKIAFDRRLIFTIGTSTTTGKTGVVTWNDIHHKTNPNPHTQFGYPDPTYLDRVLDELAVKGVTEKDIKD